VDKQEARIILNEGRGLRGLILSLVLALGATACTSEHTSGSGTGAGTTPATSVTLRNESTTAKNPPRFTGTAAENYRNNYVLCGAFRLKNLARQLDVAADPVAAAQKLARDYRPAFRQAVFEGCLDALLKKPPKVKEAP
jgi:hypothetical protein